MRVKTERTFYIENSDDISKIVKASQRNKAVWFSIKSDNDVIVVFLSASQLNDLSRQFQEVYRETD